MEEVSECLVCHAPLTYLEHQEEMECVFCHEKQMSNAKCVSNHYICDACHSRQGLASIKRICLESSSKNPAALARQMMRDPYIHMHGPEHHVLVGAALLTAYQNAGGALSLLEALEELEQRGGQVPGGICGLWGCCGAAVSAGIFLSIATQSTPLSVKSWGMCNRLTSECLAQIGALGGPRCCKRDSFTAIETTAGFVQRELGVVMEMDKAIHCGFSKHNRQCIRARCPYYITNSSDSTL